MTFHKAIATLQKEYEKTADDGRIKPRFGCNNIRCGKGYVLDMSATGLRLRTRTKPPKGRMPLRLTIESDTGRGEISAQIMWVKKRGWSDYEIGLRFTDPQAGAGLFKLVWDPTQLQIVRKSGRKAG